MRGTDFSSFYGDDKFADVDVLLREEQAEDGSDARPEELVLQCHALVLMVSSPYFKTKLEDWDTAPDAARRKSARLSEAQESPAGRQHHVVLPVPRGQLAVGQLLIKSMYAAAPDLAGVSQCQLTQLLVLADCYQVAKVMAAVSAAVQAIPLPELAWDIVTAVYSLLAGAADLPACRGLFEAAAAKLQSELGDLELAWGDSSKQEQLLSLPFTALQQLLQNYATRVASECTVLYTIECWYKRQQERLPPEQQPSKQQLRQLLGLVCMQHCGKSYVTTMFAGGQVAALALEPQELVAAGAVAGASSSSSSSSSSSNSSTWPLTPAEWDWPVLEQFPAWTQDTRPATARAAALEWAIPAEELRAAYDACVGGARRMGLSSPPTVYGGLRCKLKVVVMRDARTSSDPSSAAQVHNMRVGIFVNMMELSEAAALHVTREVLTQKRVGDQYQAWDNPYAKYAFTHKTSGWGIWGPALMGVGTFDQFVRMLGVMKVQLKIKGVH